jgi:3-hydroxyacyl-CoA dehydrogenase
MSVQYQPENRIPVVTIDNPPLNVFGQARRAGLAAAIAQAVRDGAIAL